MQGIAARVLKTVFPAVAALALLLTACDFSGGSPAETEQGMTLHISIAETQAKTVVPDIDMKVDRYSVSGTGPDGATFSVETRETSLEVTDLASGEWNITVDALNAAGIIIQKGSVISLLDPGAPRAVTVAIAPLAGYGSVDISLTWPAAEVANPAIVAKLVPYSGSEIPLTFTISSGTANVVNKTIPAGYYTLTLKLNDAEHLAMGTVEVVRVVQDAVTDANFAFTNITKAPGSISVQINPSNYDPIPVDIPDHFADLPITTSKTVTCTAETDGANTVAVWYLNGQMKDTDPNFAVGTGLKTGSYRLDVTVFTTDGRRAGSNGFSFAVSGSNREQVTLAWDPNTESDLAGYKLYYGTKIGTYEKVLDVGKVTTHTVSGLDPDLTYYFSASAYNTSGQESELATEIVF